MVYLVFGSRRGHRYLLLITKCQEKARKRRSEFESEDDENRTDIIEGPLEEETRFALQ
jgi:hypothetical protein